MALKYSLVARGSVILAEQCNVQGNFNTIATRCLQKIQPTDKYTYTCDHQNFNFLVDGGFVYLVVSEEAFGRQIPFAFLDRVKDDFKLRFGGGRAETAAAHSLNKDFGPRLREHMQFCETHPDEMDRLLKIKGQVADVKAIMMDNIEKVLDRGERIEVVAVKAENLQDAAHQFRKNGEKVRRKMWLQNVKAKLIVLGIIVILAMIIWLSVCRGFKCH